MVTMNLQVKSGLGYGAAMAASVAFFLVSEPSLAGAGAPWIAGVTSSLAALTVGWWLGDWYAPVDGERPTYEFVLCPFVVLGLSLSIGLALLTAWGLAVGPPEPRPLMGLAAVLYFGVLIFLGAAWPAIAVTFGAVAVWLAWCSRSAPNNSFKPNPLRGSA